MNLQRILVPTDFATTNAIAMDHALDLARRYGAEVILCHVFEPSPYPMAPMAAGTMKRPKSEQELLDQIQGELEQLRADNVPAEISSRAVLLEGSPHGEILRFAEKEKVDLIVMPTHGRSGLARFFMGSVAEQVVRHAPCAVLTVCSRPTD